MFTAVYARRQGFQILKILNQPGTFLRAVTLPGSGFRSIIRCPPISAALAVNAKGSKSDSITAHAAAPAISLRLMNPLLLSFFISILLSSDDFGRLQNAAFLAMIPLIPLHIPTCGTSVLNNTRQVNIINSFGIFRTF